MKTSIYDKNILNFFVAEQIATKTKIRFISKNSCLFFLSDFGIWKILSLKRFITLFQTQKNEFLKILSHDYFLHLKKNPKSCLFYLKTFFIDENLNEHNSLISFNNGKFLDLKQNCLLHQIDNFFCNSLNWAYNEGHAKQYRAQIDNFFELLFPDKQIREIFYFFIYKTLKGEKIQKFLIFNNEVSNRKNIVFNFLKCCFGSDFYLDGSKYVIEKKDKEFYNFENKRFLFVNKIRPTIKIDEKFILDLIDGSINGKNINLMFACNNSRFFEFNVNDELFLKKMLIFQIPIIYENPEQFPLWRSSFIDILLDIGQKIETIEKKIDTYEPLNNWKTCFISNRKSSFFDEKKFEFWFHNNFEFNENSSEWSSLNESKQLILKEFKIQPKRYTATLKIWMKNIRIKILKRHTFKINNKQKERRNTIKMYKLKL